MSTTLQPAPFPQSRALAAPWPVNAAAPAAPHPIGFALFILLNFVLFVRPSEVFPPLLGLELYFVTILLCLATSFPVLLEQLRLRDLERNPLTVCVIGITLAMPLSHLFAFRLDMAAERGFDFFKVLLYYLLLVGLIRDTTRLRTFLWWLTVFITICTALTVLEFYGVIKLSIALKIKDGNFMRCAAAAFSRTPTTSVCCSWPA